MMKVLPAILMIVLAACGNPGVERKIIATDNAPAVIWPYSQAVQMGNTVYLAGQIAIDPATGNIVAGGIEAETHQVMANIKAILAEAGFDLSNVVQVQAYLADLDEYGPFNRVYATYFINAPPARAVVEAQRLPKNVRVEIMVTARK